ncbi:MAG: hypothetical protein GY925_15260 [Actinomycetia bacterium]|nr:hypothetical protein [Actinomycetes bacterium]
MQVGPQDGEVHESTVVSTASTPSRVVAGLLAAAVVVGAIGLVVWRNSVGDKVATVASQDDAPATDGSDTSAVNELATSESGEGAATATTVIEAGEGAAGDLPLTTLPIEWHELATPEPGQWIELLVTDGDHLFLAADGGVFHTTDLESWEVVGPDGGQDGWISGLDVEENVIAVSRTRWDERLGMWDPCDEAIETSVIDISFDAGATWTTIEPPREKSPEGRFHSYVGPSAVATDGRVVIFSQPASPSEVNFQCVLSDHGVDGGSYAHWSQDNTGITLGSGDTRKRIEFEDLDLSDAERDAIDPMNQGFPEAGSLWRVEPDGSVEKLDQGANELAFAHGAFVAAEWNGGGAARSVDAGDTWMQIGGQIMGVREAGDVLLGWGPRGAAVSRDGGLTWPGTGLDSAFDSNSIAASGDVMVAVGYDSSGIGFDMDVEWTIEHDTKTTTVSQFGNEQAVYITDADGEVLLDELVSSAMGDPWFLDFSDPAFATFVDEDGEKVVTIPIVLFNEAATAAFAGADRGMSREPEKLLALRIGTGPWQYQPTADFGVSGWIDTVALFRGSIVVPVETPTGMRLLVGRV